MATKLFGTCALTAMVLSGAVGAANAAAIDSLDAGLPSGGSGWSGDWTIGSNGASVGSTLGANATPLDGNGDYVSVVGSGGNVTQGMHRNYDAGIDVTQEHTISFLVRIDTLDTGATGDASRAIVTQGGSAFGLSSATTWALYVQAGNFHYFDGDGSGGFGGAATDSGVGVIAGDVYSVTVINRLGADTTGPTTGGEWDLLVENVTAGGTVLNLTDLEYRTNTNPGTGIIGLGAAGDNTTSYDQVNVVPEPGSLALLGLGGLLIARRRRNG